MTISKITNGCSACCGPAKRRSLQIARSPRSAFTLIELLLVISVIAVLSSLAVGMMASAQNDARLAATRSRIQIMQSAMELELEDYEVRRSPVPIDRIVQLASDVYGTSDRLKVKNLKRMIVADLIRTEFPNGEQPVSDLGSYPSAALEDFITSAGSATQANINTAFGGRVPANVSRWNSVNNSNSANPLGNSTLSSNSLVPSDPANNSEYLYQILKRLEFGGTTVVDRLGPRAVGDTDNDTRPEIIDGFGDPMYFQFHQRNIEPDGSSGAWQQDANSALAMETFKRPKAVLPTEIRFYVTSENLVEVDGLPIDVEIDVTSP